jgi:hypothetical protein
MGISIVGFTTVLDHLYFFVCISYSISTCQYSRFAGPSSTELLLLARSRTWKGLRDKLLLLNETLNAAWYIDYVLREKRTWVDMLCDFDSNCD